MQSGQGPTASEALPNRISKGGVELRDGTLVEILTARYLRAFLPWVLVNVSRCCKSAPRHGPEKWNQGEKKVRTIPQTLSPTGEDANLITKAVNPIHGHDGNDSRAHARQGKLRMA